MTKTFLDINFPSPAKVDKHGKMHPLSFYGQVIPRSNKIQFKLGYFSTNAISTLAAGFAQFIYNNGTAEFVINQFVSEKDYNLLAEPDDLSDVEIDLIESRFTKDLEILHSILKEAKTHFFNCLKYLLKTKRIKIIPVICTDGGMSHYKEAIFTDSENNKIYINGSCNFTQAGIIENGESFLINRSWRNEDDNQLIKYEQERFDRIIAKEEVENFRYLNPNQLEKVINAGGISKDLNELLDDEVTLRQKLLEGLRLSDEQKRLEEELIKEISYIKDQLRLSNLKEESQIRIPVTLHGYQIDATNAWFENNNIGLLEMATGTGKTITALSGAVELFNRKKRLIVVIACPFIHLVEQWIAEAEKFGFRPIMVAESGAKWQASVARELQLFRQNITDLVVIATTNASLSSEEFQKLMKELWTETLFISDEAHYLGSATYRRLLPVKTIYRLGLSATPERYYDDEGTSILLNFFGKAVYQLPIEQAIGEFLTNYYYYPIPVEMTDAEFQEYANLTIEIQKLSSAKDEKYSDRIDKLLIKRARIQNNSESKIEWIQNNVLNSSSLKYTLFYAGDEKFDKIKRILGLEKKIRIHEFTGEQSRAERKKILDRFYKGDLQALIAMKCLDEGVDVPPTRTAYFLASSGNPREFIQRRGRVLRKANGKVHAVIYDLIAIPPIDFIEEGREGEFYSAVKSSFKKEYQRVKEFSSLALNRHSSLDAMFDFANRLGLLGI